MMSEFPLPKEFEKRMQAQLGSDYENFSNALCSTSVRSLRLHPLKGNSYIPHSLSPVPWYEYGYWTPSDRVFTWDPLLHAGVYYVQEASSMFLAQLLRPVMNELTDGVVLDLCAAPGGKSTLLADLLEDRHLLISNEVIRSRAPILDENLQKWGYRNSVVISLDPEEIGTLLTHQVDLLVIDAPCSGEGLFRKDPKAREEWSVANGELCAARQKRIIADAWDSLKPGGYMVYSTCTFNPDENEQVVQWMIDTYQVEPISFAVEARDGIQVNTVQNISTYQFLPHLVNGEGFFTCIVRKPDGDLQHRSYRRKAKDNKLNLPPVSDLYKEWMQQHDLIFKVNGEQVTLIEERWDFIVSILENTKMLRAGIPFGSPKGKEWIPSHGFALSMYLPLHAFPEYEVDYEQAIKFLKREDIPPTETLGWNLITYQNNPLGFIKSMGNRVNNYYPMEWRIRNANPNDTSVFKLEEACL